MDRIELRLPQVHRRPRLQPGPPAAPPPGFAGDIRATGDVLIDQLVQMHRTGFTSAVLKEARTPPTPSASSPASPLLPGRRWVKAAAVRAAAEMGAIDLHARASKDYEAKLAETQKLLIEAAAEFAPLTQASSLGAEDVVITHLINSLELDIPVFVLETGALHQETLDLLERTQAASRTPVEVYRPVQEAVVQFVAREGKDAMYRSIELRKACCQIRKLEPLERALAGQKAWITGLRREQSNARAEVPLVDRSKPAPRSTPWPTGPGATSGTTSQANAVDYNPLHDQFFPSIGCAPCTRAISLGEDFRAGRWWWEDEGRQGMRPAREERTEGGAA